MSYDMYAHLEKQPQKAHGTYLVNDGTRRRLIPDPVGGQHEKRGDSKLLVAAEHLARDVHLEELIDCVHQRSSLGLVYISKERRPTGQTAGGGTGE